MRGRRGQFILNARAFALQPLAASRDPRGPWDPWRQILWLDMRPIEERDDDVDAEPIAFRTAPSSGA